MPLECMPQVNQANLDDRREEMAKAIIEKPDEIVCTLKFTMKLKDWKQIKKTLGTNAAYVELQVMNEITDLVFQLEKTFYSDTDSSI